MYCTALNYYIIKHEDSHAIIQCASFGRNNDTLPHAFFESAGGPVTDRTLRVRVDGSAREDLGRKADLVGRFASPSHGIVVISEEGGSSQETRSPFTESGAVNQKKGESFLLMKMTDP